jgi:hypothetical protein
MRPEASAPATLAPRRKATVVEQALLPTGDRPPLATLPGAAQAEFAREMGCLVVDRTMRQAVAAELANHIEGWASWARAAWRALTAIGTHLSPEMAARRGRAAHR